MADNNNELNEDVKPMGADCSFVECSTNSCGPGMIRTVEYCWEFDYKRGTHCGCGYFN